MRKTPLVLAPALLYLAIVAAGASAAPAVKVGAAYPLTGALATVGQELKAAVEVAVDLVNEPHPELSGIPLAPTVGLPGLGGARLEVVFVDTQGDPSTGQTQTLRLITQERVAAVLGAYQSAVTKTTSAVAERYGIPFVNGASVEPSLTERGFKWFFRTTPVVTHFAGNYFQFLADLKARGFAAETVALVYENTDYGTSVAEHVRRNAQANGYRVVADIPYNAHTTDVSSEIARLRRADPDVVFFASYTSDAILFINTMRSQRYKPRLIIGDDSGFSDPLFRENVGAYAQGLINRTEFEVPAPGTPGYVVNQLYRQRTGHDLDGSSARVLQAALVLADAINRAGSTAPEAIRRALQQTDLGPDQIIMPWAGIRFDEKGQNTLGRILLQQLIGDRYVTVWPAGPNSRPAVLPYKGWE